MSLKCFVTAFSVAMGISVAVFATGSPQTGRRLFAGSKALSAGGPACVACHSITLENSIVGGTMRSDLTKMGGDIANQMLSDAALPVPTMTPVMSKAYKGRVVTADEISHISAFLDEVSKTNSPDNPKDDRTNVFLLGLGGVVVMYILIALVWRNRKKKGVKDEILARQGL